MWACTWLFLFVLTYVEGGYCPNGWVGYDASCYLFIGSKEPWAQANQICTTYGATLAQIETVDENRFIRGYLKVFADLGADMSCWIGGSDLAIEGIWEWSPSGEPFSFTDWYPGQPNNGGDCLVIYSGHDYHWGDGSCTLKYSAMCEKQQDMTSVIG